MRISVELMGSLVDYLPDSDKGQATLTLKDKATISDLLQQLQMRQKVIVAVNGEQENCVTVTKFLFLQASAADSYKIKI